MVINIRIKPIKNFDGYFIREDGTVYSALGQGNRRNGKKQSLIALKPRNTKNGYQRVYMRDSNDNKRKDVYIHRLVAQYFLDNPNNKYIVHHKDCNRHNNDVKNLEWVTIKENNMHTLLDGHIVRDKNNGRFVSNI